MRSISQCGEFLSSIVEDIRKTVGTSKLYVAFSGGLDSSVTAALAKIALGVNKVELVTTRFDFTYPKTIEVVKKFAESLGLKHTFVDGADWQNRIWKFGPACNACTKGPKLQNVKAYANGLVATGADGNDTWGQCGLKNYNGFYSPLFSLSRKEVEALANCLELKVEKIGENAGREGCMLKHLLKMLAVPKFHGAAVYKSNLMLMSAIERYDMKFSVANVKIIGPLSKNIALINLKPLPSTSFARDLIKDLSTIEEIHSVEIVNAPLELKIIANPGIYNNEKSRYWIEKGRLAPDFAVPISVKWQNSKNNRLRTFQVIDYEISRS